MAAESLRVLIPEDRLQARITELGRQIRADYGGDPILCIGVLKGSFLFMADLVRAIGGDVRCDFLSASSYHGGTESTGTVTVNFDVATPLEGVHCLVVEDIVDTGRTLTHLLALLRARNPASLKTVSLLDKPSRRELPLDADYVGFAIPDEFVVGFGLDLAERFRNLPHIAVYRP